MKRPIHSKLMNKLLKVHVPLLRPVKRFNDIRIALNGIFGPLPNPEKWVFIIGCGNSGTTLLHDFLATCPQIGSMPWEGQFFTNQLKKYKRCGQRRIWATAPEYRRMDETGTYKSDPIKLKRQWGVKYNDPTKPILLEKSPSSTLRVRWLQANF